MESQPQNPEFRINPENFHPCDVFQTLFLPPTATVTLFHSNVLSYTY